MLDDVLLLIIIFGQLERIYDAHLEFKVGAIQTAVSYCVLSSL